MVSLPPEDRVLSPYTGWTRAHWEAVADGLLAAVEPYRSADGASIVLPGRESWSKCDGLEGFARTFLLAAFRVAGGGPPGLLEPYARGFAAGPGVWPPIRDRFQPMVEAACLAIGLQVTREQLWDTLPEDVRRRLGAYLADALHHEPVDNNWWLFPVMVGDFLASVGIETKAARATVERGLDRVEPWYAGEGWYADGAGRTFDHYNGWALHLYPALHQVLFETEEGKRTEEARPYGERLGRYLSAYAPTFDADGGMLYHGRSLIYRFASATPLFAGALTGTTPLAPGATRRIASGVLRHFLDHGALTAEGLLSLGWYGPHEASLQPYSGSASPYWAANAFLGLLLPAGHPVWTEAEVQGPSGAHALPVPGFLVVNEGGAARLLSHGSQHEVGDPLYDRYAYSTRTGPTASGDVPDNHVGFVLSDGSVSPRGVVTPRGAGLIGDTGWVASAGEDGGGTGASRRVESVSIVRGVVEVRLHRVPPGSRVRQTGWALPLAERRGVDEEVAGSGDADAPSVCLDGPDGLVSLLAGRLGFTEAGVAEAAQGTAFGAPARVPVLEGVTRTGWVASVAALGEPVNPVGPGAVALPDVTVGDTGARVLIVWPDGIRQEFTATGPV